MCRNIHTLYNYEPPATDNEVRSAALQYVRKISGFTKPSQVNAEAFELLYFQPRENLYYLVRHYASIATDATRMGTVMSTGSVTGPMA